MSEKEPPREATPDARERDVMEEIEAIIGWRPLEPPPAKPEPHPPEHPEESGR